MKFQPKTEKEIAESNLWPVGEYSFEIIEGTDEISKSGNEMIKLKVHVFNDEGNLKTITDYLLESIAYKLHHAAAACNLTDKYEEGELQGHDFVGKTGTLKLGRQIDKSGQYPDKNSISDYLPRKDDFAPSTPRKEDVLDDEIPWA